MRKWLDYDLETFVRGIYSGEKVSEVVEEDLLYIETLLDDITDLSSEERDAIEEAVRDSTEAAC
jgi:hypothetical protein